MSLLIGGLFTFLGIHIVFRMGIHREDHFVIIAVFDQIYDLRHSCLTFSVPQTKYQQLWEKAQGDLELDFVGFCTGICVLSNVSIAKATLTEAKVCVIEEACACVTPETHKTAIEAMKLIQVDVI